MIIAGTGHRPNKLGGYTPEVYMRTTHLAVNYFKEVKPELIISGMAQGWDFAIVQAAIKLGIPFDAYIPFVGQELVWPQGTRLYYHELLKRARQTKICSEGGFTNQAMTIRNRRMVDACDELVALWDGSPGGTNNCLIYASCVGKGYVNLWSEYVLGTQSTGTGDRRAESPVHKE